YSGRKGKGSEREGAEKIIQFRVLDFGFSIGDRGRKTNSFGRRSRKSWSRMRGHASQHRVHGGRSAGRTVWSDMGKIDKVGRTVSEMWCRACHQTGEFYESQRLSTFRGCGVLQNRAEGNSGRAR